jgi:hypothetical protein
MTRTRTNGLKFEDEVSKELEKQQVYYNRLHTPFRMYAGVTNPADFSVCTSNTHLLLETKETDKDSFSLYTMRQRDKANALVNFKHKCPQAPMEYVVLVHFISHRKYVIYCVKETIVPRQMIRAKDVTAVDTLKEAIMLLKEI